MCLIEVSHLTDGFLGNFMGSSLGGFGRVCTFKLLCGASSGKI
jgi:hypothetical protein